MTIEFGSITKHAKHQFVPDTPLEFKGKGVEDYFIAAGWAAPSTKKPKHTYEEDEVNLEGVHDPAGVRHNESGLSMKDLMKHGGDAEKAKKAGAKPMEAMVVHDATQEGQADG